MLQGQVDLSLAGRTIEDLGHVNLLQLQDLMSALFQGKVFTGILPETARVLVLNTKDQDYRHTFIAAALYTWSDNISAHWEKREQLSIFLRALIFHSGALECCWSWSIGGIYF